jgi:hypothetical protein
MRPTSTDRFVESWATWVRLLLRDFRRHFTEIKLSALPHMPPLAQQAFENQVRTAKIYLEYGSGGSSVLASAFADQVISVDSDRFFLRAVAHRIKGSRASFVPFYVDIGYTGAWGVPVTKAINSRRLEKWKRYPAIAWRYFESLKTEPDLIFVDGRFRVACVLESLMHLRSNSETTIMLDDYGDRPYYQVIEEFVRDLTYYDRLVCFKKRKEFDLKRCRTLLEKHFSDWR